LDQLQKSKNNQDLQGDWMQDVPSRQHAHIRKMTGLGRCGLVHFVLRNPIHAVNFKQKRETAVWNHYPPSPASILLLQQGEGLPVIE
jgi:hypothetical protein